LPSLGLSQTQNFGTATPSVDDIINGLQSNGGDSATGDLRTRSVYSGALLEGSASLPVQPPPARPSISMQVQFAFNSDQIADASRAQVDNLAAALSSKELQGGVFTVVGHTDAVGADDYNMALSWRRAASVKAYLVAHGVDPSRLTTLGKGKTDLLNKADPNAAENRRVEIVAGGI
ncbi:MAG: OmpA family protein, partial [Pseudomonadales bacterium]|nr:OmpA family protein [Pseudomonadales bacterium]